MIRSLAFALLIAIASPASPAPAETGGEDLCVMVSGKKYCLIKL